MRRVNHRSKARDIRNIILEHINNNLKDYIILILFFLVGIILGVIFINNANQPKQDQISQYINGMIESLKGDYVIDNTTLLKLSIIGNIKLAIILWFVRFYSNRSSICLWNNNI